MQPLINEFCTAGSFGTKKKAVLDTSNVFGWSRSDQSKFIPINPAQPVLLEPQRRQARYLQCFRLVAQRSEQIHSNQSSTAGFVGTTKKAG